jgi:hypothetical protein
MWRRGSILAAILFTAVLLNNSALVFRSEQ